MQDETCFVRALPQDALAPGESVALILQHWSILLVHGTNGYCAVLNRCSHAGASLTQGRIRAGMVQCPLHGAQFDLTTGACRGATPYPDLRTFMVRIQAGMIEIAVPTQPPGIDDMPLPRR